MTVPDVFSLITFSTCRQVAPREEGCAVVDRAEGQIGPRERGSAGLSRGERRRHAWHWREGKHRAALSQEPGGAEKGAMQERIARAARMQAVAGTVEVAFYSG